MFAWAPTPSGAPAPGAGGRLLSVGRGEGCKKVGDLGKRTGDLLALLPVHEVPHGSSDWLAFAEDELCLLGDGHDDPALPRLAVGGPARGDDSVNLTTAPAP